MKDRYVEHHVAIVTSAHRVYDCICLSVILKAMFLTHFLYRISFYRYFVIIIGIFSSLQGFQTGTIRFMFDGNQIGAEQTPTEVGNSVGMLSQ